MLDSSANRCFVCGPGNAQGLNVHFRLEGDLCKAEFTPGAAHVGYDNAAKIAKKALKNKTKLKDEALKSGLISEKEYDKIVDPKKMIKPS